MCIKHNALLLLLLLLRNTHLLKILRWENPLVAMVCCVYLCVCVWHSLEIVQTHTHTQHMLAKCMVWFNVDIYRCARERARLSVSHSLFCCCVPIAVYTVAVCVHIYALGKRDSTRNIIQNSNIIHFNIHSEWWMRECRCYVYYIIYNIFFSSTLCLLLSPYLLQYDDDDDNDDNRQCVYSIGFSGLCCRQRCHCHCMPCAIQVENTCTCYIHLSTFYRLVILYTNTHIHTYTPHTLGCIVIHNNQCEHFLTFYFLKIIENSLSHPTHMIIII